MTKLRGYIPTMTMMVFLALASSTVNAGIIVSGRADKTTDTSCETTTDTIFGFFTKFATFAKTGIIVSGRNGIIVSGRNGIIVSGRAEGGCTDRSGIIVSG